MRHGHRLAWVGTLAAGTLAWSPPAAACGDSGFGAGLLLSVLPSLLIVLLMSVVSLLSMRAAARAVGRMRRVRDSRGLRIGSVAIGIGQGISIASLVASGGLMLALLLVW